MNKDYFDEPKFMKKQIEALKEHNARFKRQTRALKELLVEEIEDHKLTQEHLEDVKYGLEEALLKLRELNKIICELKPGTRLTKDLLEKLNNII